MCQAVFQCDLNTTSWKFESSTRGCLQDITQTSENEIHSITYWVLDPANNSEFLMCDEKTQDGSDMMNVSYDEYNTQLFLCPLCSSNDAR